jgi:glycosyltransferase involved in cell wall biosynthesis
MTLRPPLTALVTTLNEEGNIRECLESLAFADRILLVDSFSTDRTVEIARSFPAVTVVQREFLGSAAQKNWAMDRVETPWLLIVDADERVTEPLAREITATLERSAAATPERSSAATPDAGPRARAFAIRRRNFFLGREIRHSGWSTDEVVRLLERDAARYPQRRVHADLTPEGHVPTLREPFIHYTCRSLDQYLAKVHRFAAWGAADAFRAGRAAGPAQLVLRPLWRFFRMYVVQAGFLDGGHGLVLCALQAWGVFLKWAKVWEWQEDVRAGRQPDLPKYDESWETPLRTRA